MYDLLKIAEIINAEVTQPHEQVIADLLTDSRRLQSPHFTLFFALPGQARSGNAYIEDLIKKDVTAFVVENNYAVNLPASCCLLKVDNVLIALQQLAAYHRKTFSIPVIGITGSNGKTIVKEMLDQLLQEDVRIIKSPKSYNSQIGVPLSVWGMNDQYDLAIFEAGISQQGEMENLQFIIQPTVGLYTFNGSAHAGGFKSQLHKIQEKLRLFKTSSSLVFNGDDKELFDCISAFQEKDNPAIQLFSWGYLPHCQLQVIDVVKFKNYSRVNCTYNQLPLPINIPFSDNAGIYNSLTCCAMLLHLGISPTVLLERIPLLKPIEMRLELKQGLHNVSIINDSYSSDLESLRIALDFLKQQKQYPAKTLVLSDVIGSGLQPEKLYSKIADMLRLSGIQKFIGVGPDLERFRHLFAFIPLQFFFASTQELIAALPSLKFEKETILIKGARTFELEKISRLLEARQHKTVLEIDLDAIQHNIQVYRAQLLPHVKMMVMVKASGYGSGSFEIANLLQHLGVGYLAVAYTDEGIALRNAGITLPIVVLNISEEDFSSLVEYNLQPEIFSLPLLKALISFCEQRQNGNILGHLKLDTGMHRLGFIEEEIDELCFILGAQEYIKVASVFTHLAASDNPVHDEFTRSQVDSFQQYVSQLRAVLSYDFAQHVANTSAISRFPQYQFDMVRLGIGAYGIDANPAIQKQLHNVTTLKTHISQIKKVKKGESVGYGRNSLLEEDTTIAVVRIGYADGYRRSFGNGNAAMVILGVPAKTIGNICMDMTMLDVTEIPCKEGMEVIVFGIEMPVQTLAIAAATIPYEMLTSISQRVPRIYYRQ